MRQISGQIVSWSTLICALVAAPAWAQVDVTADGTIGTVVNYGAGTYTITGGQLQQGNTTLLHSFDDFSLNSNTEIIHFDLGNASYGGAANGVTTVIGRVTGGNPSTINGRIQLTGGSTPDLFLINPNGIVFGTGASLNVPGSFVASTAESVLFANGVSFGVDGTTPNPLLTVSTPLGLQMGQTSGGITVAGSGHQITIGFFAPANRINNPPGLQVGAGKTLSLIGNGINFSGGVVSMANGGFTGGGHLEVASVRAGRVNLQTTAQRLLGDYSAIQQFNDIHLAQQSLLDASGGGGSIQLQGRNISMTEGSATLLQHFGGPPSSGITIHATGALSLTGTTSDGRLGSFIQVDNLGASPTGNISVNAAQLVLNDGGNIHNWTFTPIDGGNVDITVTGSAALNGFAPANPLVSASITTITLNSGKAGDVNVSADSIRLLNTGSISTVSAGSGQAGALQLNAADVIEIAGNNPFTTLSSSVISSASNTGNAGRTVINTARLIVRDSGILGSSTVASGAAGNVVVNASQSVEVRGRSAGSILPARIASTAEILDPATQAALGLPAIPSGNAGSLTINTPALRISDEAFVTVKADGPGSAGNVQINANTTFLNNQGRLTAAAQSGEGGNIILHGNSLILRHGSLVSATAGGTGNGGNISINAPVIAGFENSDIIANAVQGRGGNIQITTQGIFGLAFRPQLTPENDITASSQLGVNGTVTITTPSIDPGSSLVELPANFSDVNQQIAEGCSASQGNSFTATGRGGLPMDPSHGTSSDRTWNDIRDLSAFMDQSAATVQTASTHSTKEIIVEISGWRVNAQGQVELIASPPDLMAADFYATCSS